MGGDKAVTEGRCGLNECAKTKNVADGASWTTAFALDLKLGQNGRNQKRCPHLCEPLVFASTVWNYLLGGSHRPGKHGQPGERA